MLFSLLAVCIAAGTMQVVAFSDLLFKKLAYGWRMVVFAIPFSRYSPPLPSALTGSPQKTWARG